MCKNTTCEKTGSPAQSPCFIPHPCLLWRRLMSQITILISFPLLDYIVPSCCAVGLPDTSCLLWASGIPYLMKSQKLITSFHRTHMSKARAGHLPDGAERHFRTTLHFPALCHAFSNGKWHALTLSGILFFTFYFRSAAARHIPSSWISGGSQRHKKFIWERCVCAGEEE